MERLPIRWAKSVADLDDEDRMTDKTAREVLIELFRVAEDEMIYGSDPENADRVIDALEKEGFKILRQIDAPDCR